MPNVRASSGMIGTTWAETFGAGECAQQTRERHRGRHLLTVRACLQLGERVVRRQLQRLTHADHAPGQRAVERPAPLHQVLVLA